MPLLTRYGLVSVFFMGRIVMNPVKETRKCLECEKCYYYDRRMRSSIASTEDIVKGIDNILEKNGVFINVEDNKK